jgi:hypothetical protein
MSMKLFRCLNGDRGHPPPTDSYETQVLGVSLGRWMRMTEVVAYMKRKDRTTVLYERAECAEQPQQQQAVRQERSQSWQPALPM